MTGDLGSGDTTMQRPPGWPGCPTCVPDAHGRYPIGWCGPDCERRARRLAQVAATRQLGHELAEARRKAGWA